MSNLTLMERYNKECAEIKSRDDSKFGVYTNNLCPNCKRQRLMIGDDKKKRCEKCAWCVEDSEIDQEFRDALDCR